jgi:hypothetical protein
MSLVKNYKLTERDLKIPALIEDYHLLSTSQIQKLLFPSLQKAQTRLLRVYQSGLVKRFQNPVLIKEGGKGECIYYRGRKPKLTITSLIHTVELNDIRIAFEVASRRREEIDLVEFMPEYKGETDSEGRVRRVVQDSVRNASGTEETFIPDAVVCLRNSRNDKKILLFVEIDLASEKLVSENRDDYSVLRKILLYKEYLRGKDFETYNEKFEYSFRGLRVLMVMNSVQRIRRLRKEVTLKGIKRFVWFAEKSEITPIKIFERVWWVTDASDNKKYSILGSNDMNSDLKR